jgi:hypothetical protein
VQGPLRIAEFGAKSLKGVGVAVVTIDVAEEAGEFGECLFIQTAVLSDAVASTFPKLVDAPPGFRDTDYRHLKIMAANQRLERGKDLFEGEISGGTEENESV